MKLSTMLIIGTFGIFLIFGVYGYYSFSISIQEVNKLLTTRNEGFAFNMMQDLDEYIDKRIEDFRQLTKLPIIQESLMKSNQEFLHRQQVQKIMKEQDPLTNIENQPFISPTVNTELISELTDVIDFYKSEYDYDVISELYITNIYGANVVLDSETSDYRHDDEKWWQEAKAKGTYIGETEYDEKLGNYIITIGLRIDDQNREFLGVLRVSLTLNDLIHEFINDAEILNLQNRSILLINEKGQTIYSNGIQDFRETKAVTYFDLIQSLKDVGTVNISDNPDDPIFISYAKSTGYKQFEGFGWTSIVDQSNSSFTEEFVDLKNSFLVISILGMVSSVMIGLILSYFISNPLRLLSKMAKQFSGGDFDSNFKGSKIMEINMIGNSFNSMGQSLKKLIETEKKLAESHAMMKNERLGAIGQLSASMAHDLKNPLATIKTSATIIQKQVINTDPEIEKAMQRMDRAIFRMSHQIDDVLNFVRITPLNLSEKRITDIINESIDLLEIPNNIKLKIIDSDFTILCDVKKLEIVFTNIILNAIQAIGKVEGQIDIKSQVIDDNIKIEISDSGPKIPSEILDKVFEPLFTTKEKGTGLGLSSCKNIIEQHGGTISAHNNPTTFTIILPKKTKNQ
ncbi:Sensor protein [Nitrosarchaeum koreense MY1]|uniref:histidine kinase n=1 Tax=Nitrosarchaeum koreense MY1 TaxID=1001994 RepID=F9CU58_9ARCH|nr:sensor histidine kinase [Nitrosarchaeum koreense]EGP94259.1 Sensor protein [Nitrosarchaeum koreense MY1]